MLDTQPPFRSAAANGNLYRGFFRAYGLNENPFGISPDPKYLLQTPQIQEALAELMVGVTRRKGFMLLSGETGTGKTTVLNSLQEWLRTEEIPAAFVFNPHLQIEQLLEYIIAGFGVPFDPSNRLDARATLHHWLLALERRGRTAVVILDEAQGLSLSTLEEIRLQLSFESQSEPLLQVILAGQPELEQKLRGPELRQLWQRMTLRCRMVPLTQEQTLAYISSRLRAGGAKDDKLFSQGAVSAIYSYSLGIPRIMNLLCEHALINAYVENARPISARIVDEVAREFELGSFRSGSRSGESVETEEWFSPAALARAVAGNRSVELAPSQPIAFVAATKPVEITECAPAEPSSASAPADSHAHIAAPAEEACASPLLAQASLPPNVTPISTATPTDSVGALDDLFNAAAVYQAMRRKPALVLHDGKSGQPESVPTADDDEFESSLREASQLAFSGDSRRPSISRWRYQIASAAEAAMLRMRAASGGSFDWVRERSIILANWTIDLYYACKDTTANSIARVKDLPYREALQDKFYVAMDSCRAWFQRVTEISQAAASHTSQRTRSALQRTYLAASSIPSASRIALRWLRAPITARRPVRGTHFAPVKKTG